MAEELQFNDIEPILTETETLLTTIPGKVKDSYCSLTATIKEKASSRAYLAGVGVGILIKVIKLLVDPKKGYILLSLQKREIVAVLSAINRKFEAKDDLPDNVRPMVETLETNLAMMKQITNKTEEDIEELIEALYNALDNKVKIDPEELKRMEAKQIKVTYDLKKCDKCLADAQKKLEEIENAVSAKLALYGGGALVTGFIGLGGIGLAGLATHFFYGATGTISIRLGGGFEAVGAGQIAAVVGVWLTGGLGSLAASVKLLQVLFQYSEGLEKLTGSKREELGSLKKKMEEIEINIKEYEQLKAVYQK